MKKRNTLIIATVILLGIITFVVVKINGRTSTFKQNYSIENVNSITKIFMTDKLNNKVTLTRVEGDTTWRVDNTYEANQGMMRLFLETLKTMQVREQVSKNAAPNVTKQLAAKSVKTEVYQRVYFIDWFKHKFRLFPHEKLTQTYFIGHETQDMMGSYAYRKGDKMPVIVYIPGFRGFITPRFIADPTPWRSHRIVNLKVQDIQSVELEIPSMPEESFAIRRKGKGFIFELSQKHQQVANFDTARVAQFLSSFVNLNFDEYAKAVPKVELDTTFSRPPRTILRITDTKGKTCELKTYIKYANPDDLKSMPDTKMYDVFDLNRLYAVVDKKDTVLIQYFVFDNILQPASFFLGRNRSEFAK